MTLTLRILIIIAALAMAAFMMRSIKASKMRIEDTISWALLTLIILLLAIFPEIADFFADLTGVQSTQNFIFLFFIFLLFVKSYHASRTVSELQTRVRELSEHVALDRLDRYERTHNDQL